MQRKIKEWLKTILRELSFVMNLDLKRTTGDSSWLLGTEPHEETKAAAHDAKVLAGILPKDKGN